MSLIFGQTQKQLLVIVPRFIIDAYEKLTGSTAPCFEYDANHYICNLGTVYTNAIVLNFDAVIPFLLYAFLMEEEVAKEFKQIERDFMYVINELKRLTHESKPFQEKVMELMNELNKAQMSSGSPINISNVIKKPSIREKIRNLFNMLKAAIKR